MSELPIIYDGLERREMTLDEYEQWQQLIRDNEALTKPEQPNKEETDAP